MCSLYFRARHPYEAAVNSSLLEPVTNRKQRRNDGDICDLPFIVNKIENCV